MGRALSRFTGLSFFNTSLQALVRELPLRALLPLGLAITLLFSVLGPVTDMLAGARQPLGVVLLNCVLGGLIGLGYAFASMRRKPLVFVLTGLAHAAWTVGARRVGTDLLAPSQVPDRLAFDALLILGAMTGSYGFFLRFINVTAARYLRVRAEIDLAHEIHQVLVPGIETRIGGFSFYGLSEASGEVGGDLVDVVDLGARGWFGYVADVSGHGVPSGVLMGMVKSAVRMALTTPTPLEPMLSGLNDVLYEISQPQMFATFAALRPAGPGRIAYTLAGHLPILCWRAATDVVEELAVSQVPLGMLPGRDYIAAETSCASGDVFLVLTDGLTEVFDRFDREFGMEGVRATFAANAQSPLPQLEEALLTASRSHGTQLDDQSLILIRVL